jgi:hypothetical protein
MSSSPPSVPSYIIFGSVALPPRSLLGDYTSCDVANAVSDRIIIIDKELTSVAAVKVVWPTTPALPVCNCAGALLAGCAGSLEAETSNVARCASRSYRPVQQVVRTHLEPVGDLAANVSRHCHHRKNSSCGPVTASCTGARSKRRRPILRGMAPKRPSSIYSPLPAAGNIFTINKRSLFLVDENEPLCAVGITLRSYMKLYRTDCYRGECGVQVGLLRVSPENSFFVCCWTIHCFSKALIRCSTKTGIFRTYSTLRPSATCCSDLSSMP